MSIGRRSFLRISSAPLALAAGWRLAGPVMARSVDQEVRLVAAESDIDVGAGAPWRTWAYNAQVPGPEIRVTEGQRLRVTLENRLPEPTTIHWHGLPVPSDMDGVPDISQRAVQPGETFTYEFDVPASGTFFYHSHVGLQLDRGLSGPLIVRPRESGATPSEDREQVLVFDDWLRAAPQPGGSGRPIMGGAGPYDGYLLNGRVGTAATPVTITRGERLRLRLINASSATTFRIGITGHRLRVTHADGQPIAPVDADTVVLGMGERYDATVTGADPGAWQLVAGTVDSPVPGVVAPFLYPGYQPLRALLAVWPVALTTGRTLAYEDVQPEGGPLTSSFLTRSIPLVLSGSMGMMGGDAWMINGERYPGASPLLVREGEWIRLEMQNRSMVRHPMHLHGHFFHLVNARGLSSLKDTVLVDPMGRRDVVFQADHTGRWMFHCHNAYHMEAGMARIVEYA